MGPLGELGALFSPGMRHELEERRSKEMRREEEGNARDGDLRIDLESGIAVINSPAKPSGSSVDSPDAGASRVGRAASARSGRPVPAADEDFANKSEGDAPAVVATPTANGAAGAARSDAAAAENPRRTSADRRSRTGTEARNGSAEESDGPRAAPTGKASRPMTKSRRSAS